MMYVYVYRFREVVKKFDFDFRYVLAFNTALDKKYSTTENPMHHSNNSIHVNLKMHKMQK